MAVRKKAKQPRRKAVRRARPSRKVGRPKKVRKAAKRSVQKRAAPKPRAPKARKVVNGGLLPVLSAPLKYTDDMSAPRNRSRIPVEIEIGGRRERGAIVDMSSSGARIVGVRIDLPPGTPLQIHYSSNMTPVLAEVVRVTDDGFAAKFLPR